MKKIVEFQKTFSSQKGALEYLQGISAAFWIRKATIQEIQKIKRGEKVFVLRVKVRFEQYG